MLRWFENTRVYHPDRVMIATGAELGRPFEDVLFKAKDGVELHGWYFPANPDSKHGNRTMLVCHGNAGNISHRLELCRALLETGVNVFVFDYRGFGRSQGKPGEEGTYLDAQAAHKWLLSTKTTAEIIAFGESLGGGIASELAIREQLVGLVLESTFSCIPDVGAEIYPWLPVRWISTIRYDTLSKLPQIQVPVMVMHSRADELIGFHHAEKNYAIARDPKLFWELSGDHNDPLYDGTHFVAGVTKFLEIIEARERKPGPTSASLPK